MPRRPVIQQLMCLSSGTIAGMTNLTRYDEIEKLQGALVNQARKWVENGVLDAHDE